ncbi:sugar porter family MFS transporter [Phialemonium atrogriseum]|uniref:Sugar porter family MFS transporter n=1 Tax=Phialemonium atrogriseum TaxID=1093897 RepID=A0AAJ0BVC3_9PEZI|nr:sugar porter family MFS transporter [Phialemonium atrogriseum]KAK1763774.1 sugar porter family MFS transporter [Phialemonium atrogriseum]
MSDVAQQGTLPTETASLSDKKTAVQTQQTSETASSNVEYGKRDDSVRAHFRFLWVTVLVGCALLEYGFDKGIVGSFQAMVGFLEIFGYQDHRVPSGWNIASVPQQIISSFMLLGAFMSCFATGPLGSVLGRRWCIVLGVVLLIVSIIIMIVTTSMGLLYFARLVMGVGNGLVMTFTMVYISELAPAKLRGLAYGFMTTWITAGTAIGLLITNATQAMQGRACYQIPLYVLFAMPAVTIISMPFMPESPRWLLLQGKEEQAWKSLTWIRNGAYDDLALRSEFEEMRLNALHDLELQSKWLVLDLLRGTNLRRTLLCVGVGLINAGIGAMFVLAFGTYFFKVIGVTNPFKWIVLTQWMGVIGLFFAYYLLDRVGRRTLLLVGTTACGLSMLVLGVMFSVPNLKGTTGLQVAIIFLTSWFQFFFNFGVVPITYLVAGELPAQNMRAYTAGISTGTGYVAGWLTTFTAPYFINPANLNWGGKYGFIWFGSSFLVVAFVWFLVPEVQGRSLEEIEEMFDKRLPAKDFPKYVSENAEIARREAEKDLYGPDGDKARVMRAEGKM